MPQPHFVFENLRDWAVQKEHVKMKIKEYEDRPAMRGQYEDYDRWLEKVKPTHQEAK